MPSSRLKCEKSSPIASVAEVKIQARGWSTICLRNSSAGTSGVTCSCSDWPNTSTQRTSFFVPSSPIAREQRRRFAGAARAGAQAFAALGLLRERLAQRFQRRAERLQRVGESGLAQRLRPAQAQPFLRKTQAQIARRLVQLRRDAIQFRRGAARGAQFQARVARELDQLRGGHRLAEEQARGLRQLVRLVEDHRVAGGQQFGDALVAQRHVGEEQVVVDHHHVGRERVLARAHHEAVLVVRAFLAEAVLARRGGVLPDRRVLGHLGEVGAVAGQAAGGELLRSGAAAPRPRAIPAAPRCARAPGGTGRRSSRAP